MADEIKQSEPIKSESLSVIKEIKTIESSIGGVSIRGILAFLLVFALVIYPFFKIPIPQEISTLAIAVCSFYYGKQQSK